MTEQMILKKMERITTRNAVVDWAIDSARGLLGELTVRRRAEALNLINLAEACVSGSRSPTSLYEAATDSMLGEADIKDDSQRAVMQAVTAMAFVVDGAYSRPGSTEWLSIPRAMNALMDATGRVRGSSELVCGRLMQVID
ncbi:MAG: hypothetical protein GF350_01800 [Chitinivibrionales bacterium]|nr:hypothetical protein [Chitinivibrionales bacterium]